METIYFTTILKRKKGAKDNVEWPQYWVCMNTTDHFITHG